LAYETSFFAIYLLWFFVGTCRRQCHWAPINCQRPSVDGLSIIKEMREQKIYTPVLILSAKRSLHERVEGLQTGGDDYLVKPFAFSELIARIQALMRRSSAAVAPAELKIADLIHTVRGIGYVFKKNSNPGQLPPVSLNLNVCGYIYAACGHKLFGFYPEICSMIPNR